MKLIVGLGNPGSRYEKTRHNLGFMVVEKFFKDFELVQNTKWVNDARFRSDTAEIVWQPKHADAEKVILTKPKTYMNNSGLAASLISSYYKVPASDIWIIHDDIDLPLGFMKIRFGGGSAGHKGIESVMEKLGTEKFWRFRLGIGAQKAKWKMENGKLRDTDDFVLGEFRAPERGKIRELIKRCAKAIGMGLEEGLDAAMNRFNTK